MLDLIAELWRAFIHDKLAAKRWIRGSLMFATTVGGQLVLDPTWQAWTFKQWVTHLIPATFAFAAGSMQSSASKKPDLAVVRDQAPGVEKQS